MHTSYANHSTVQKSARSLRAVARVKSKEGAPISRPSKMNRTDDAGIEELAVAIDHDNGSSRDTR